MMNNTTFLLFPFVSKEQYALSIKKEIALKFKAYERRNGKALNTALNCFFFPLPW